MSAAEEGATSAAMLEIWVREEMGLPPEASVEVSERPGTDPRCSPVVTEVAVSVPGEEPYSIHIEQALGQMGRMDLVAAMAFGGGH